MTHLTWMEICFSTGRSSPRGQQIADRVPGTYEDLRFVAPEHCGFAGWYLHIYIHLHGLTVVIWAEGGRHTCLLTRVFTYSISAPTAQQTKIHKLIPFECLHHNCALSRKGKHTNSFVMESPINVHLLQHVKPSACPQTVKSHATLFLLTSTLWNYRSGCADTNLLSTLSTLPLSALSHRWSSAAANDVECCETMWRVFIRKTRRSLWQCSRNS